MGRENITFGGQEVTLIGTEIKIGERAPNFRGIKQNLEDYNFYEETDNRIKLISVAPSLDTKVCSYQAIEFNRIASELNKDVIIINITVDLPYAQQKFCSSNAVDKIQVVSDHKYLDFGGKYGFVIKEMRLLSRGVVLIERDNTVKYVEYVNEITESVDFDKVKEEISKLK
ncbi:MAG: thiol peroxidase [Bacillota bacterium]|nr:thiol peroxidase [Bacillota bacterium]